jgi:hypothetical protein
MQVADFRDDDWPEGYGPEPAAASPLPPPGNDLDPPAWIREVPPHGEPIQQPAPIVATPFAWRDEASIPPRKWLYGRHLLRRFVSVDVAAGGTGKSSVKIGEAMAMACGRDLYGVPVHDGPLTVWLYNLEDPAEEIERRIHATAKWFRIAQADVAGRLYVDSGRDQRCIIATETEYGARIAQPVYEQIKQQLTERRIDVLTIDPFVSSHEVSENDNRAIDAVVKAWGRLADECNCSINLVHHVRKGNGQEANADSARGAKALVDAARSVVVFNRMTPGDAGKGRLVPHEQRRARQWRSGRRGVPVEMAGAVRRRFHPASDRRTTGDRPGRVAARCPLRRCLGRRPGRKGARPRPQKTRQAHRKNHLRMDR